MEILKLPKHAFHNLSFAKLIALYNRVLEFEFCVCVVFQAIHLHDTIRVEHCFLNIELFNIH